MKIRLSIALIVLSLFMSLVGGVMAQDGNLLEVASANPDFSTLVSLVEAAGLSETLSGEGPFTVFAPTNDAFAALPPAVVEYLGANPELLTAVLSYHVLAGQVTSDMVSTMGAATVQGGELAVVADDAGVTVDGVAVTAVDIVASNGVIHVIDEVLIPAIELPAVDPLDYSDGSIVSAGSSTVFPLVERMGELWEDGGGIAPSIDSIGSGAGIERFCVAGETDIANSSRAIKDEEIASCATIGRTPIEFRVGTDALAVVVSSSNDFVTDVSSEELALIFSTAVNWSDVRAEWPAEAIQRFIPGTDSGTFDYFVEIVFDKDEAPILAGNPQMSEDDNVLVQGVEGSPYAIGFFGYAYYQENAEGLKTVSVDGITPSFDTAEDGSYSLSRPLFLYSDAQILTDKPEVAAFINFTLAAVNDEIGDVGYFPAAERNLRLARLNLLATGIYAGM
jgi:phosphate transport system substrate-binding protein